ncbi:MAG: cell division protein ZapA [Acidobacteria bacterium]|nr:MAG: cell division protein ZapA [Acidobacteriota bacterium]
MTSGEGAEVLIFGERYTLRSEDGPDHLNRVADYVDRKFHEVAQAAQTLAPSKIAVLASLNIADELVKRDEAARRLEGEVLARIDEISQLLHRGGAVEGAARGGPDTAGCPK